MSEIMELAQDWAEEFGVQAADDAAEMRQRGLLLPAYNLILETEEDAAEVVGASQSRRDTARCIRAQAEEKAAPYDREAERIEERFHDQLKHFTRTHLVGKAKSITLVTGHGGDTPTRLGFRMVPGGLRIVDKDAATGWGLDNEGEREGSLVKKTVTYSPIAAALKERCTETGEIPDGCEVVADLEKFYIRPGGEKKGGK